MPWIWDYVCATLKMNDDQMWIMVSVRFNIHISRMQQQHSQIYKTTVIQKHIKNPHQQDRLTWESRVIWAMSVSSFWSFHSNSHHQAYIHWWPPSPCCWGWWITVHLNRSVFKNEFQPTVPEKSCTLCCAVMLLLNRTCGILWCMCCW